ncbi:MAG: radical SAM protein [Deltaproteobacteria bacterium]|nr:radical SAM protein [Deltaproteobacteria bacterium]
MLRGVLDRLLPRGRARAESFGGIIAMERPSALVFVDRAFMRSLGLATPAPVWATDRRYLTAPVEAHLTLTSRCPARCRGCYVDATPSGRGDDATEVLWERAVDELARMGVFHLALGGGEATGAPFLLKLARRARARGMVPNLTTSGLGLGEELLGARAVFGQVNVSLDGVGEDYALARGWDGFEVAAGAIRALQASGFRVGINLVLTRRTFPRLERTVRWARQNGVREVEILRFKPIGRGAREFSDQTLTVDQRRELLPAVLRLARRYRVRLRLDCSMAPFVCAHRPDPAVLTFLGIAGCFAGDHLVAADSAGRVSGCSFLPAEEGLGSIDELSRQWDRVGAFVATRAYLERAGEPCRSCRYLPICRGGCRAVALHEGDAAAPDPECPRVATCTGSQSGPRSNS